MESAVLSRPLFTFPATLKSGLTVHRCLSLIPPHHAPYSHTSSFGKISSLSSNNQQVSNFWTALPFASHLFQNCQVSSPKFYQFACVSSTVSKFGSGGGGDGNMGGMGGSGGDEGSSAQASTKSVAGEPDEAASFSSDVIILDVGGMTCGGCAASVKRILESQSQVLSARVNLTTETAFVRIRPEIQLVENWKRLVGEKLASHLTDRGFKSSFRDYSGPDLYKIFQSKMDEKLSRLAENGRELALSWALCSVCLIGHAMHFLNVSAPYWIHALHSTKFHLPLSLFALLGPGRRLILDGLESFSRGSANMNTLVGLGAISSFTVSTIAVLFPKLGWKVFFEEPVMLIAFVLLGRNLEQRAKLKATSDMRGLLSVLPTTARFLTDSHGEAIPSVVEIPSNSLAVGDQIVVLPGDRIPVDGIVKMGRSTVDESSLTGEPMPVTKLPGDNIMAGGINLNGTLTVEVRRPGNETFMAGIIRLVEEAQSREAPVQRLADKVAGNFTYGVMALSVATFAFWSVFGGRLLPAACQNFSSISLALQLSCNVLVIACPCALGLATPTAMLIGTSLGATRGMLLRGGNILEKFAKVDTVVFDKTGTLTVGRPVVSKVVVLDHTGVNISSYYNDGSDPSWTKEEVLRLAAGVESNTVHPVGKAIVEAAQEANCHIVKAVDGTFIEEPGSGAVAIVERKKVAVGTHAWVQSHGIEQVMLPDVQEFGHHSVVHVGVDGTLRGIIYLEDKIRDDAELVIESLAKQGITTYMLSGDTKPAAEYVASTVGIPAAKVISEVKPHEKMYIISQMQKNQKVVAMVGDGINDAAALASSDIGVAMGDSTGAAGNVSSVVLMGNRLSQLLDALELSKLTMQTIKQNLWWAFGYNIIGIPIAAGLLLPFTGTMLTPSVAGALMGLSSVGVMVNSLFLKVKFDTWQKHANMTDDLNSSRADSNR